jgi:hypothetical protein
MNPRRQNNLAPSQSSGRSVETFHFNFQKPSSLTGPLIVMTTLCSPARDCIYSLSSKSRNYPRFPTLYCTANRSYDNAKLLDLAMGRRNQTHQTRKKESLHWTYELINTSPPSSKYLITAQYLGHQAHTVVSSLKPCTSSHQSTYSDAQWPAG